jgi:conjugative transfer signal peptidase TraF
MNAIWPRFSLPLAALVLIFGLGALWALGFRLNLTPSVAVGLYRLASRAPARGDLVAFCPQQGALAALALERGYLGPGLCASGTRPLLKRLVGLPGDGVEIVPAGILVNGQLQPRSQVRTLDSHGRPLPRGALISNIIPANKALLLSDGHTGGFDSRYFGLVDLRALRQARSVMTFE